MRADEGGLDKDYGRIRRLSLGGLGYGVQQFARPCEILYASGIGDEPIVADAVKATGQNMQQEAAHELLHRERHGLVARTSFGSVILPAEGNATFIERDKPPVGDRHPVGVA